jgi:hypothetical protein
MGKKVSELAVGSPATVAAFAALGMPVLLASGTLSTPTAFVVLALPSGYSRYRLRTVQFATNYGLFFALSDDGGVTWYKDDEDFTGYSVRRIENVTDASIIDGYGYLSSLADASDPSASVIIDAEIFPGDGVAGAMVTSDARSGPALAAFPFAFPVQEKITNVLYADQGRMNAIRLCGGAEDGHIPILAGSYWLYGVPTP